MKTILAIFDREKLICEFPWHDTIRFRDGLQLSVGELDKENSVYTSSAYINQIDMVAIYIK